MLSKDKIYEAKIWELKSDWINRAIERFNSRLNKAEKWINELKKNQLIWNHADEEKRPKNWKEERNAIEQTWSHQES